MVRTSNSRIAKFIAKLVWRHGVTIAGAVDHAAIRTWICENVGKYDVWVNYNFSVSTDDYGVIVFVENSNKIEYRFRSVSSAVLFKLTFCELLAH